MLNAQTRRPLLISGTQLRCEIRFSVRTWEDFQPMILPLCRKTVSYCALSKPFYLLLPYHPIFVLSRKNPKIGTKYLSPVFFRLIQIAVDLRPHKQKPHAEIQPQHYHDHCGKTPVNRRHPLGIFNIDRKTIRKNGPGKGGGHRSRNL